MVVPVSAQGQIDASVSNLGSREPLLQRLETVNVRAPLPGVPVSLVRRPLQSAPSERPAALRVGALNGSRRLSLAPLSSHSSSSNASGKPVGSSVADAAT